MIICLAAIIIPGQSGTYRHLQDRVTGLLAESGQSYSSRPSSIGAGADTQSSAVGLAAPTTGTEVSYGLDTVRVAARPTLRDGLWR